MGVGDGMLLLRLTEGEEEKRRWWKKERKKKKDARPVWWRAQGEAGLVRF